MSPAPKPLEGVRVVDFCVVWAGPFATMLLADLGAEVIKPENPYVLQPLTRGVMARPSQEVIDVFQPMLGGYPNGVPGERPWNCCPAFVSLYRNKKSFSVDLRQPEGMEALRKLVAESDVVYENNATGTLEKLGITYEWLQEANPQIIFVRVPAYGNRGPYAGARALGVHLEAVMGHTLLRGYDDMDPSANSAIYSGDYLAGAQGAFAVMSALWHREKTGEGQQIEIAQAENAAAMFTQALMDYSLNGTVESTIGNRDIFGRYPCGVYPAKSPGSAEEGEDRWVSIAVEDDEQWGALVEAMGRPEWARDRRFATNAGRAEHYRELDERLGAWTAEWEDYELMHELQGRGIAAAPVLEASRMFEEPHLRERGFFREQTVEGAGTHEYVGPIWHFPETPVEFLQPPVRMGEHNEYVYKEVLGFSEAEYEDFRARGHIAEGFDPSVP